MWWVFGIAIWLALGVVACRLAVIDWNLEFDNDSVDWESLWVIFITLMALPIVAPLYFLVDNAPHQKQIYKIFFAELGDWFKDHTDWRW